MKKQMQSVFIFTAIVCFLLILASCGGRSKAVSQMDDMARQIRKETHETEMPKTSKPKRGGDKSDSFTTAEDKETIEINEISGDPGTWTPPNYGQPQVTQEDMDEMWRQLRQIMGDAQPLTGYPMTWQPALQFSQQQMDELKQELYKLQAQSQQLMNNNYQYPSY